MPYELISKPRWLHVRYFGDVYPSEIVEQSRHPEFINGLENLKRIIYDYSDVSQTHFSEDNIAEFAVIGRLFGHTYENIEVICIPSSLDKAYRAEQYKSLAHDTDWKVHLVNTLAEAEAYFSE